MNSKARGGAEVRFDVRKGLLHLAERDILREFWERT
jgi:hypothetical protein